MEEEQILERVKAVITDKLGADATEVTSEAAFVEDLRADSLDIVELVMGLEEDFNIEIPDEDAEKITKVSEAVNYIQTRLSA